jgi:azurin
VETPTATTTTTAPPADGPAREVKIGAIPAMMKFTVTEFDAFAGEKLKVVFDVTGDVLQHNIVFGKPGSAEKIHQAALAAMTNPDYIPKLKAFPNSPDILFKGTKLVGLPPGEGMVDTFEISVPAETGDYPYLCTFPGHSLTMRGVMHVKPRPAGAAPSAPSTPTPAPAPAPSAAAREVKIGAIPAMMKFTVAEFDAKPGEKLKIVFDVTGDVLQHNIVVGKPGSAEKIHQAALAAMTNPDYIPKLKAFPNSPDILFKGTKLVGLPPGEGMVDAFEITVPAEAGDYPYLCTFPGHSLTMRGVMHVKP